MAWGGGLPHPFRLVVNHPLQPKALLVCLAALALLTLIPPAQATPNTTVGTEGFESFTPITEAPTADWYTYTSARVNAFPSTSRFHGGSQSLFVDQTTGWAADPNNAGISFEVPSGWDACAAGMSVSFWMNIDALTDDAGASINFYLNRAGLTSAADTIAVAIESDGLLDTPGAANVAAVPLDTWFDLTIQYRLTSATAAGLCDGSYSVQTCVYSITLGSAGLNVCNTAVAGTVNGVMDALKIVTVDTTGTFPAQFFVDDLTFNGAAVPAGPGVLFCANPSESDNFGYDYLEDVEFDDDTQAADIALADAFVFEGDNGNSAYAAKGLNPGTKALLVRARIEAAQEAADSVFRVAFTTGATTLTAGAAQDSSPSGADFLASSNGEDGGNFDNHVQVYFLEDGSHWQIRAYRNVAGAGLVQIPGSVNYGANPNSPTTFQVVVNSGTDDLPTSVDNHTIGDIGDEAISVQDDQGNIIFNWQIPSALFNVAWKDAWMIGKGANAFNAFTYLDDTDQLQDDDSTCIWDLLGAATTTGSIGLAPGSTIPPPEDQETEDEDSNGDLLSLENVDTDLFMGVLLILGVIYTGTRQGVLGAGLVAFFLVGLALGYSIGWIPLWLVLVLFVICLAAVWFLPKPSGDGLG